MRRLKKNLDAILFEEITLLCIKGYPKKIRTAAANKNRPFRIVDC